MRYSAIGDHMRAVRVALLIGTTLAAVPALAQTTVSPGDVDSSTPTTPQAGEPTATTTQTAGPADDAGTPRAASGVEEIVVTAQKREQNLQDVPISITALSQNAIVANRILDVRDLSAVAPSLTVRTGSGGGLTSNYSMRGVVTGGTAAGSDKGISLYIDGVYLQAVTGATFELADIERIEVLKGPQGTLFGRNATAGAISIITRNPSGEFGVHQELTYGNYDQFRSKTRVDLPRFGPFTASVIYTHSERRGDTKNLGAGTVWDYSNTGVYGLRKSPKTLGDQNTEAFGATVKFNGIDGLDVTYKGDYAKNNYTPEAQGVAFANFAGIPGIFVPGSTTVLKYPGLGTATGGRINGIIGAQNQANLTPITTKRPKAVNNSFTTPGVSKNQGHALTALYHVNDEISVKNILAYRKTDLQATYQLDGEGGLLVAPNVPFEIIANNSFNKQHQWSNETQVNIDTDWFTVTAGYLHFHDHIETGGFSNVPNVTQFTTVPNYVIPFNGNKQTVIRTNSDAWFVQPEIHLTSQLDLVLGARITKDKKAGTDNALTTLGSRPILYRNSKPTFLAGLNYKPADHLLVYAKYSTGYISGGQLATLVYKPETSESYEAGIKADLFDRRLRTNLAVYDVNYKQLQFVTSGLNVGIPQAATALINGGDGKAKGFEFEATAVPIDGLTITGSVGYLDFKFKNITPLLPNFLPLARPKWTSSGSIEYDTPEVLAGGHLVFRGDVNYKSKTYLGYNLPEPQINSVITRNSFIVNGRVALADISLFNTKAQVALWGRNLFDNRQLLNVSTFNFLYPGGYERARTYGVDVFFDF